ncbi:MAG: hypothetical protein NZ992_00315 [Candidatus Korarchaeum sp.]|nr:hypothetical protein [Candidatus Korarchaeum sp.]MDW8035643.1 hypothetical protein [Candidatus Korarchaeum sp.]
MRSKIIAKLKLRRCVNCGKVVRGKGFEWRGRVFCSRRCKKEYREKHKKRRKIIFLPSDTFEAVYWRRS